MSSKVNGQVLQSRGPAESGKSYSLKSGVLLRRLRRDVPPGFLHLVLMIGSFITAAPLLWMFVSAFKFSKEIIQIPPTLFPREPTLTNYVELFTTLPFLRFMVNSLIVTILSTVVLVILTALVGFAFAKFEFLGKGFAYVLFLLTMMIADEVVVLPLYLMISKAHLNNTYMALIIPFLITGFAVFLMRQFISTLPTELIEAAVIDGAGYLRIFWEIILPLIGPALSALAIFNFIWMWNMFMWPTVVADTQSMMTVQVALSRFTSMYLTRYDLTMAAASITTLPILIIYLILQRTFVKGIALTGMKQ